MVVALSATWYIEVIASNHMTAVSGEKLQVISRSIADSLSQSVAERVREVEVLSHSPLLVAGAWDTAPVRGLLDTLRYAYQPYASVTLVDASGKVVVASGGVDAGTDVSDRAWFMNGLDAVHVGRVHEVPATATEQQRADGAGPLRLIHFSAPVHSEMGLLRGVVTVRATPTWFNTVIENALSATDAANGVIAYVQDSEGNTVYPFDRLGQKTGPIETPDGSDYALVEWEEGGRHLTARTSVRAPSGSELGWQVILHQPIDRALAAVAELRRDLLVLCAMVALLSMSVAYAVASWFNRPLAELVHIARRIDQGDDKAAFPERSSIREFGLLFESLRGMTETLFSRKRALRSLNASLEQKVRERTDELEVANQKLEAMSLTDALTGMANRRRFDVVIAEEWARASRSEQQLGVLLIDVDFFKQYNDHYGHLAGDRCLSQIADLLKGMVRRSGDLAARYGGEEFVVVAANTSLRGLEKLAESIRRTIESAEMPHEVSSFGKVTVSVGAAVGATHLTLEPYDLLAAADAALYEAKGGGRNCVRTTGAARDEAAAA